MPDIGTPKKREAIESRLMQLDIRAEHVKKPYIEVAEIARRVYADCPLNQLSSRAPRTHWNNYKTVVRRYRSKLSQGDPRITAVRNSGDIPPEVAEQFKDQLQALLSRESFTNVFQACGNDVVQWLHAFIYVHPGPELEWINWFHIKVDNAQTGAKDINSARYIIIDRYYDAAEYIAMRGAKKLRALGYEVEDEYNHTLPRAGKIPGGEAVGVDYGVSLSDIAETRTGLIKNNYGNPFEMSIHTAYTTGSDDGLVCEQEYLIRDSNSPSGWSRYYVFDHKIVEADYLDEYLGQLPIAHWAGDFLSGQFEQPALLLLILPNQVAKTFVSDKVLQSIAWLDFPTVVKSESERNKQNPFTGKLGEEMFEDVIGSTRFLDPPVIPTQYFEINEILKDESQDNSGVHAVAEGKDVPDAKSGVAIRQLQQSVDELFQMMIATRDEFFRDLGRLCCLYMLNNIMEEAQGRMIQELGEPVVAQLQASAEAGDPNAKQQLDSYLPPGYGTISYESLQQDLSFSYKIIPPITREEKIDQFLRAVSSVQPITGGDPMLSIKLASILTENVDIGQELEEAIAPILQQQQMAQMAQQQAQAEGEQVSKQQDAQQQEQQAQANQGRAMEMEAMKAAMQPQKGEIKR